MGEWLAQIAQAMGQARVRGSLYVVSHYPALVPGNEWVTGEVYAVPASAWTTLDAFEEALPPLPEYERQLSPVQLQDGTWLEVWVYWYARPVTGLQQLSGGDWLCHVQPD